MTSQTSIKLKIINHLIKNGKKRVGEKIWLKKIKELQKTSYKQPKQIINSAIMASEYTFQTHEKINKKSKWVTKTPFFVWNQKTRTSLAIKLILKAAKNQKETSFYSKLQKELFSNAKNKGLTVMLKNEVQSQILLLWKKRKNLFFFYRWK